MSSSVSVNARLLRLLIPIKTPFAKMKLPLNSIKKKKKCKHFKLKAPQSTRGNKPKFAIILVYAKNN